MKEKRFKERRLGLKREGSSSDIQLIRVQVTEPIRAKPFVRTVLLSSRMVSISLCNPKQIRSPSGQLLLLFHPLVHATPLFNSPKPSPSPSSSFFQSCGRNSFVRPLGLSGCPEPGLSRQQPLARPTWNSPLVRHQALDISFCLC